VSQPAQSTVILHYDGPALADHRMDARDFASALIAFANLFRASSKVIWPGEPDPRVEIQAIEPGSMSVQLLLSRSSALPQGVEADDEPDAPAPANPATLSTVVLAAISAMLQIGRNKIRKVKIGESAARISFADGTKLELPEQAWKLVQDIAVRQGMREVLRPLASEGIDSLDISVSDTRSSKGEKPEPNSVRVESDEVRCYEIPAAYDELLGDDTRVINVALSSVVFAEGSEWLLSDGETTFFAGIADTAFRERVERGEVSFSRTDLLKIRLRTRQWRTEKGLHADYNVLEILEHVHGPRQVPLLFADSDS
jgi:hypothetical protein